MSLIALGCTHRSSSLEMLERLAVVADDLPKALHSLVSAENLSEVVVLSTCHRTEVYAYAERFHGGCADVRDFLARHSGLAPEMVADEIHTRHDADAVRHLFGVTAGLDSVVIGEHEILGQVRTAWQAAQAEHATGATLDRLFRRAVETGKRARATTAIGRGITSVSQAAVALAAEHLGGLEGRRVLVLGAGEMATGTLAALADAKLAELAVVNRTWARATEAARACGGRPVRLSHLQDALESADLLVTTTGATDIIVEHSNVTEVMGARAGAPLLIVDVAVPRDVDPAAGELNGVTLLNMDDISAYVGRGHHGRNLETREVRAIVESEVDRYQAELSARTVAPLISAMRGRATDIAERELARHRGRLGDLDAAQQAAVESLVRGITNKILHEPTVRLKDAAGHARGDRLAEAVRDLFDL